MTKKERIAALEAEVASLRLELSALRNELLTFLPRPVHPYTPLPMRPYSPSQPWFAPDTTPKPPLIWC